MKRLRIVAFLAPVVCCAMWQAPSAISWLGTEPPPPASSGVVSGYMLGSPLASTLSTRPALEMHWPGFGSGGPPPMPAPPDFAGFVAQIFKITSGASPILAMSMGLESITVIDSFTPTTDVMIDDDLVLAGKTGVPYALLQPGTHGWVAIEFTVNETELKQEIESNPGIELAQAIADAVKDKDLGGSVFSFVVPDSNTELLPQEFESVKSIAAADLGVSQGDQLQGVDLHAVLFYTDLSHYTAVFSTHSSHLPACIYFTLRVDYVTQFADQLKQQWGLGDVTLDAATIFMSRWTNHGWQPPTVYRTAASLGISTKPGSGPAHDLDGNLIIIDGLAIDAAIPGTLGSDKIMFSLDAKNDPDPADQFRFAIRQQAPPPPRRVIVPNRTGGYGSLGKMTKAGAAHGDFCQLDPVLRGRRERKLGQLPPQTSLGSGFVVDDFSIARRLKPDGAYTPPRSGSNGDPQDNNAPPAGVNGDPAGVAEEALAVASYRWNAQVDRKQPVMRTCMSWPDGAPAPGATAWLRYGVIDDLAKYVETPASVPVVWHVKPGVAYNGAPLVQDLDLPTDGLLLPPPNHNHPGPRTLRAYAAQWYLEANGKLYTSPLSVLRF
jgi:hypothetical protein